MLRAIAPRHAVLALAAGWLLGAGSFAYAQTLLRWKFKPGETIRYVITLDQTQKMQMGDKQPMPIAVAMTAITENVWKIESVDNEGVATITQTIDRMQMKMQGPQGVLVDYNTASDNEPTGMAKMLAQMANAMVKKATMLRMNPRGEILEAKPPQGLLESVKKLFPGAGSFGDFFTAEGMKKMQANMQMPEKPVTKGEIWTTKENLSLPAMFGSTLEVEHKYEYLGPENRDGIEMEKIGYGMMLKNSGPKESEAKPTEEKDSQPKAPEAKRGDDTRTEAETPAEQKIAAPLVRFKDINATGTIYFDNVQGRIVDSSMKVKGQAEISVAGMTQTMDTEGTTRMKLQPGDAATESPHS